MADRHTEGAMSDNVGRFFGILAALGVLWIVVYWWWEPAAPRISFDTSAAVDRVAEPLPREPVPEASRRPPPVQQPEPRTTPPQPQPVPAQQPPRIAVIPPRFHDYTIKRGDTLDSISRAQYGSPRFIAAIREANALSDLEVLKPGRVIRLPDDPNNVQGKPVADAGAGAPPASPPGVSGASGATPSAAQPTEYTVKPGDTLSEIAQAHYGSTRYADLIYKANRDALPSEDSLKVGQKLKLPPKP